MVPSLAEITSTFQPCSAAKRSYIRNRSPANSAASSPPVPARISSITLRSSMASLGSSATRICCASSQAARGQRLALGFRHAAHLGIGRGIGDQRVDAGDLGVGGAIGLHGVDQRIEFGEFARDPHVVLAS